MNTRGSERSLKDRIQSFWAEWNSLYNVLCGKTKWRRDQGDMWWWNKDVKEGIARKKDAHKEMCKSGTEANKARPCTRT